MAKQNKKVGALKAAATGLAIGAAAGAAAVVLSDKKRREQLKKTLAGIKVKGEKSLDEARKKLEVATKESKEKLTKELNKTAKKLR